MGDSWFSSVPLVSELAKEPLLASSNDESDGDDDIYWNKAWIGAMKQNHRFFPNKELQKLMEDFPSGASIVLKSKCPINSVELLAIGYKYNRRKVLCFLATPNAGSTKPGALQHTLVFCKHRC